MVEQYQQLEQELAAEVRVCNLGKLVRTAKPLP